MQPESHPDPNRGTGADAFPVLLLQATTPQEVVAVLMRALPGQHLVAAFWSSRPSSSVILSQPRSICCIAWSREISPARNWATAVSRTTPWYWADFGTRRSR